MTYIRQYIIQCKNVSYEYIPVYIVYYIHNRNIAYVILLYIQSQLYLSGCYIPKKQQYGRWMFQAMHLRSLSTVPQCMRAALESCLFHTIIDMRKLIFLYYKSGFSKIQYDRCTSVYYAIYKYKLYEYTSVNIIIYIHY